MNFRAHASSSAGNLYEVSAGAGRLIIDPGVSPAELRAALGWSVSGFDAALLSHHHADHSRAAREVMSKGVEVFATEGCWRALGLSHHRSGVLEPGVVLEVPFRAGGGRWRVMTFPAAHDAEGAVGFFLEAATAGAAGERGRLLYAVDTAWVPVRPLGLTHIALEVNHSEALLLAGSTPPEHRRRVLKTHMSLERALEFLATLELRSVEEIWLLHMSDSHSDAELFRESVASATGKPTYVAPARAGKSRPARSEERTER